MSITSKFLPLHLSFPNPNRKFPFPTPTPRPLSHPKPLTIRCAKKRQRTGNLRYPSEKKKLKSKQKTQIDEADKFEGFWRLYKLGVPVHRDPGKDFLGVSDALLKQIAKALKFPVNFTRFILCLWDCLGNGKENWVRIIVFLWDCFRLSSPF